MILLHFFAVLYFVGMFLSTLSIGMSDFSKWTYAVIGVGSIIYCLTLGRKLERHINGTLRYYENKKKIIGQLFKEN